MIKNILPAIMDEYGATLFSSLFTFSLTIKDPQNSSVYHLPDNIDGKIALIVISESGENQDVIDYINRFKIFNIKIISITNSSNCTIASLSNVNIPYYITKEIYQDTNITSQLPVIFILEDLARKAHNHKANNFITIK